MTTEAHNLKVSGLQVAVVRKAIKNLHLGVYPPDGRVRVAAPLAVSDAAVRVAVKQEVGGADRLQHPGGGPKRILVGIEFHQVQHSRLLTGHIRI